MAFEIVRQNSLGGGLNALADECKLEPNEFRRLYDVSLEDGETLQNPPGDTRINISGMRFLGVSEIKLLAEYNKSNGSRRRYAKVNSVLYEWTLAGLVAGPVVTGLWPGEVPGWAVHEDKFNLVESSGNRVSDGAVWDVMIRTASPAPAVAIAGGGVLTGTYRWLVTRYSPALNRETPVSAPSITLLTAGHSVNVGPLAPALDSVYTEYRIYRTLSSGNIFYYVASLLVSGGTYFDNIPDLTIAANAEAAVDSVVPGPCAFVVVHLNRLFLSGFFATIDSSAVMMSEPGFSGLFPVKNRITFAAEDGDRITGMWVRGTRLFIAKKTRIFELIGDDPVNFEIVEVERGRGVRCQRCTTTIGDREFLLDTQTGPFFFSNASSEKVGVKILPTIRRFNESYANHFVAEHEPQSRAWWMSVYSNPTVGSGPDTMYAFHYERNAWVQLRLPGVTAMGIFHDVNERPRLCYGTDQGYIHMVDADGNKIRANLPGNKYGKVSSPNTALTFFTDFGGIFILGDGWAGAFVTVVFLDDDRRVIKIEYRQVKKNWTNAIEVSTPFSSAPRDGDLWFLGAFFMDALTGRTDLEEEEKRKHVPYFWVGFSPQDHSQDLYAALLCDDEGDLDDTKLANFSQFGRFVQQLPAIRGGGGRRPNHMAVRFVGVCSNLPFRIKGYSIAHQKSAYDRPKTQVP
jgi:hypothetical protein